MYKKRTTLYTSQKVPFHPENYQIQGEYIQIQGEMIYIHPENAIFGSNYTDAKKCMSSLLL